MHHLLDIFSYASPQILPVKFRDTSKILSFGRRGYGGSWERSRAAESFIRDHPFDRRLSGPECPRPRRPLEYSQERECVGKTLPLPIPRTSPLSLNLSTRPASLPITGDIDLDNQASREPIITGSFNQLMPIQPSLNPMPTWRKGVGMQKKITGINSG